MTQYGQNQDKTRTETIKGFYLQFSELNGSYTAGLRLQDDESVRDRATERERQSARATERVERQTEHVERQTERVQRQTERVERKTERARERKKQF